MEARCKSTVKPAKPRSEYCPSADDHGVQCHDESDLGTAPRFELHYKCLSMETIMPEPSAEGEGRIWGEKRDGAGGRSSAAKERFTFTPGPPQIGIPEGGGLVRLYSLDQIRSLALEAAGYSLEDRSCLVVEPVWWSFGRRDAA